MPTFFAALFIFATFRLRCCFLTIAVTALVALCVRIAALVLAPVAAKELGVTPLGYFRAFVTVGVDPAIMGMGPWPASEKALKKAGLRKEEIDLWELNEAFAAQSLGVLRELRIPKNRVNVNGGAIALGHPIGASGARILTTLVHTLRARGGGRGAASLCIGGGMGIAVIVEAD